MHLGYPSPRLLRREITEREWVELKMYYSMEPFGPKAQWTQSAVIAATVANSVRGKRSKAAKIADFMPKDILAERQHSVGELRSAMFAMAAGHQRKQKFKEGLKKKKDDAERATRIATVPKSENGDGVDRDTNSAP